MYEIYCELRDKLGVKDNAVALATGVNKSTFSDWKSGRSSPKQDKLQKIADYFDVPLEYLMTGNMPEDYYLNEETAAIAQEIYDDPDLHALFDAARGTSPEDMRMATELLKRLKGTNNEG